VPAFNERMRQAALVSGSTRYTKFADLDADIMRDVAPWAPEYNGNAREFISKRVGCYVYQPTLGAMDLAAACLE